MNKCPIKKDTELKKYFIPLRNVIEGKNGFHTFAYADTLLDGTLLIDCLEKYGFEQLKEVLNYHNIEHSHNIIGVLQKSTYIPKLTTICKDDGKTNVEMYNYSVYENYSHVLEYLIINNYSKESIDYIFNEMQLDSSKEKRKWDYKNKVVIFERKNIWPSLNDIIFSTIMKIIVDSPKIERDDGIIFDLLTQYFYNLNCLLLEEWKIIFLVVASDRTENTCLFKFLKKLIKDRYLSEKQIPSPTGYNSIMTSIEHICSKLSYCYDIVINLE
jgi:hypothetical protein